MNPQNSFLRLYLEMVEETESPRQYHIWSALLGVSACLGRRVHLPFGHLPIYPNLYVLLTGNPAMRKGTAMNIMKRIVRDATSVRFAPTDTGGQRQGLILAMEGLDDEDDLQKQIAKDSSLTLDNLSLEDVANIQLDTRIDPRDRHVITVAAAEFSQFIGQKNTQFITQLETLWDGEPIDYKISGSGKARRILLDDPLLNLMGCTTPAALHESLPAQAGGRGFLSRVILIHGTKKYKPIPRPVMPDARLVEEVKQRYDELCFGFEGLMKEDDDAYEYSVGLYEHESQVTDARFIYYNERRYTHFLKLGMVLAAARGSKTISIDDYQEADRLLQSAELQMPDALGEFGLSPIAAAKQIIVEFIRAAREPVSLGILRARMQRDLSHSQLTTALADLVAAGQIIQEQSDLVGIVFVPRAKESEKEKIELFGLMKGNEDAAE